MLGVSHRQCCKIGCVNDLKEVGIAFRIWEGDNGDHFPMYVPVAIGGAQELIATGNVAGCFQVMSNELSTPKILLCPNDPINTAATNWNLSRTNISYFIGFDALEDITPDSLLSGDDDLVQNGRAAASGVVTLAGVKTTWTLDRHKGSGNVLNAEGNAQGVYAINGVGAKFEMNQPYPATNRVVIP